MAYDTFTFTGRLDDLAAGPHDGTLQVTANVAEIRDATGKVALSGRLSVDLDATGSWSVTLPADDPTLSPSSGLGYTARVITKSGAFPTKTFAAQPGGSTLDWSQIPTSVTPTPASDTAVTTTTIGSYLDGGML